MGELLPLLHVAKSLTLVFHQSFLFVQGVLGPLALFLQAFGGINRLGGGYGERFFDGRDEAPDQQRGHYGADHVKNYSFRIFHNNHSIK